MVWCVNFRIILGKKRIGPQGTCGDTAPELPCMLFCYVTLKNDSGYIGIKISIKSSSPCPFPQKATSLFSYLHMPLFQSQRSLKQHSCLLWVGMTRPWLLAPFYMEPCSPDFPRRWWFKIFCPIVRPCVGTCVRSRVLIIALENMVAHTFMGKEAPACCLKSSLEKHGNKP